MMHIRPKSAMPLLRCMALMLVLCAPVGEAARAQDASVPARPLVTLLFTANSEGAFEPCPVCGGSALGGLARRATALARVRAQGGGRVLTLAGGHEFTPFRAAPAGEGTARALAQAYAAMSYDLGLLSARDHDWLRGAGAAPGPGWLAPAPEPRVRLLDAGGVRVGVLVLPHKADIYAPAEPEAVAAVVRAARELRPQVDLLVGLGVWGWQGDATLLEAPEADFDVLLSSGPGQGTGVRAVRGGRTLDVRPDYQGWSVIRLDILGFPEARGGRVWTAGAHYSATKIKLDATIPADEAVSAILAWI